MEINPVDDTLKILELLKEKENLGISEISKILKMNKNKVFRLLITLEIKGIVARQSEEGPFTLGKEVLKLTGAYLKNLDILKVAKPYIVELKNRINENVYLSMPSDKKIIYIYEEKTENTIQPRSRFGLKLNLEDTAAGRILKKALKEKGFFIEKDICKFEEDIVELASVIRDEFYRPKASISIVLPYYRFNEDVEKKITEELIQACQEITELLFPVFHI
jgi:DNA-binding IclR family transcriptional regulator